MKKKTHVHITSSDEGPTTVYIRPGTRDIQKHTIYCILGKINITLLGCLFREVKQKQAKTVRFIWGEPCVSVRLGPVWNKIQERKRSKHTRNQWN